MKNDELEPCPFCGCGFSITKTIHETYYVKHICKKWTISQDFSSYKSAVDAINTRPNTPQSSEVDVDLKLLKKQAKEHIKQSFEDDENLTDAKYTVIETINYLSENGYLKTPAENVQPTDSERAAALEWVENYQNSLNYDEDDVPIIEAIKTALSKTEWLPIESAPKDALDALRKLDALLFMNTDETIIGIKDHVDLMFSIRTELERAQMLNETIDSMRQTNAALVKKVQRMQEALESILAHSENNKEGQSRTMHMIAINRYAKQALSDAPKEEK